MDYQTANDKLQGRNKLSRKMANNTYLVRHSGVPGDSIHLKLHNTYVVTWYADGRIELNSGGWRMPTTKDRINSNISGYRISQKRGVWYLYKYADEYGNGSGSVGIFADGLTIHSDGSITGMEPLDNAKEDNKLRSRVQRFAKKYMVAFKAGEVPAPSNGDCLYCNAKMQTADHQTIGEYFHDKDHIASHIDESYFVPSLLARAFETLPHSHAMGWALAKAWNPEDNLKDSYVPEFVYQQLQKSLYRYMLRQLGQAT